MMAYVLIAITGAGLISSAKFDTLAACQEARSLALYGETREEKTTRDAAFEEHERIAREKWYADHPRRLPETDEERRQVESGFDVPLLRPGGAAHIVAGGMVQDDYFASPFRGSSVIKARDIAKAYCLAEVPGEPTP